MLIKLYDTESKSRNALASPLGEEGHEVAKGCTRVRMIMILDVDVTAERRHYNTHRPAGDTTTLGAKGPVKLKNPWAEGPSILRTFPSEPSETGGLGPLWYCVPPSRPAGKRVTGFSVAYGPLRIQFPCHPAVRCGGKRKAP